MIITTFDAETGRAFQFDTVPSLDHPTRMRVKAVLLNAIPRPEADSTIGMVIGVCGSLPDGDLTSKTGTETTYNEKSRKELRQPHLESTPAPVRWITMKRLGDVKSKKQRNSQNDPLVFEGFIERRDEQPGVNVYIARAYGMLIQRTDRFIVGKKGKSVFNTWDEPLLIEINGPACSNPEPPKPKDCSDSGPSAENRSYVTPQELALALDRLKDEIRAMLQERSDPKPAPRESGKGGGGLQLKWNGEEINNDPPTPVPAPTQAMPTSNIGISFDIANGMTIDRTQVVNVMFRGLADTHLWFAIFANGQWWPWQEATAGSIQNGKAPFGFASNNIRPGPCALAVSVRDSAGRTLSSAQLNLEVK